MFPYTARLRARVIVCVLMPTTPVVPLMEFSDT
jgi:hypothetical protein